VGVDIFAVLPHRLTAREVAALPARLQPTADPVLARVLERNCPRDAMGPAYVQTLPAEEFMWSLGSKMAPKPLDVEAEWARSETVWINGPLLTIGLFMGSQTCFVVHGHRWGRFLTEQETNRRVREVTREVARVLDAGRALYVPDGGYVPAAVLDLVGAGHSFAEITLWLHQHCGPPAIAAWESMSEAITRGSLHDRAVSSYLVDVFSESRTPDQTQ
jgi:hypothetical protein